MINMILLSIPFMIAQGGTNEQILSLKCLDSHQNDRNVCDLYFTNYKNCRRFWATVQRERKLKKIEPYLPPIEERAKIKADYLNSR
ncbi:coiled-coil-helix-coiled-coil-helix domain-containing protein 7 isoform X2 [Harpegnathos saltator]|uniref:coiled-coil-helix-coiled-coil-helix domain-containing protein 7 isoform X2 n=1 Tax=Harpegnathos saltator TaxID=610380 RepID=UPI00058E2F98|nr:coiled-coil-helix-coiled-coil-helix domain-containing protein 7 isoform X2 [Harpegnathos saltator]